MNRDDRIHGALLILNELVRISSMEGEVRNCVWGPRLLCLLLAGKEGPCAHALWIPDTLAVYGNKYVERWE